MVEIVGYALPYFSGRFGRRPVLCFTFISAGSFCISSMLTALYGSNDNNGELRHFLFIFVWYCVNIFCEYRFYRFC